ncbi:MAG: sulfotransferase [Haliscomenobacter sp.]|nr:sulfotransferase [Haliscomenobacter sp.]MBP9873741.1 sulfotransferase [Haliscomenobacter sp.]
MNLPQPWTNARYFRSALKRPWGRALLYPFFSLHPRPVFLLGNQKSGTTAIAKLLALAAGKTEETYLRGFSQHILEDLYHNRLPLEEAIRRRAKFEFSRELIKECNLTFFYSQLRALYPDAPKVFIVRDPRDNIRSILHFVQVPGNLHQIPPAGLPEMLEWQRILDNSWLGVQGAHYIDSMAGRWVKAAEVYLQSPSEFILVRYEDFKAAKTDTIHALCDALHLPVQADIAPYLEVPFQPPGPPSASWVAFFGENNLNRLEQICSGRMREFGYFPSL